MKTLGKQVKEMLWSFIHGHFGHKMPRALKKKLRVIEEDVLLKYLEGLEYSPHEANKWANYIKGCVADKTQNLKVEIADAKQEVISLTNELEEDEMVKINNAASFFVEQKNDKELDIFNKAGETKEALKNKKFQLSQNVLAYDSIVQRMTAIPTKKSLLDSQGVLIGSCALIALLEGVFSYEAFDKLGFDSGLLSFITAFGISSLIGLGCHFFGEALARRKFIQASLAGLSSLSIVLFLIFLRSQSIEITSLPSAEFIQETAQQEASLASKNPLLAIANLLTLVFGLFLAERVNRYRPFFKAKENIESIKKDIDGLKHRENMKDRKVDANEQLYGAKVMQRVLNIDFQNENRRSLLKKLVARNTTSIDGIQKQYKQYEEMGTASIKAMFDRAQAYRKLL